MASSNAAMAQDRGTPPEPVGTERQASPPPGLNGSETTSGPGSEDDAAPWYEHRPWMPKDPLPVEAPVPPKPMLLPLSARYDVHSFATGSLHGVGSLLRVGASYPAPHPLFDASVGFYFPNGAFTFALSVGRYSRYTFLKPLHKRDGLTIDVATGHVEVGVFGLAQVPFTLNLA